MRPDGVLLPGTPAGAEVEVRSRSGVDLVVVAERVGLPFRVRPVALSTVLIAAGVVAVVVVGRDAPAGPDLGAWPLLVNLGAVGAAYAVHRVAAVVQRAAVRARSTRWKVGVVAPDPHRAPRGQWVLLEERLPAGEDPRDRMGELVDDVRSGGFDTQKRVLGLRASLRR